LTLRDPVIYRKEIRTKHEKVVTGGVIRANDNLEPSPDGQNTVANLIKRLQSFQRNVHCHPKGDKQAGGTGKKQGIKIQKKTGRRGTTRRPLFKKKTRGEEEQTRFEKSNHVRRPVPT